MKVDLSKFPPVWFEDEEGNKTLPDYTGGFPEITPQIKYMHTRFVNEVRHTISLLIQKEDVSACRHPRKKIVPTDGWIDGVEGQRCRECGGTRTRNSGKGLRKAFFRFLDLFPIPNLSWPAFEATGSAELMVGTDSYSDDLATALVLLKGYTVQEAIIIASCACERCNNVLRHEVAAAARINTIQAIGGNPERFNLKDEGYPLHSEEWKRANTSCPFCEDEPKFGRSSPTFLSDQAVAV